MKNPLAHRDPAVIDGMPAAPLAANILAALSDEGGALVLASACSPRELAMAQAEGRHMAGGYVLRTRQWREHAERAIENVVRLESREQPAGTTVDLDATDEFVPLLPETP